EAQAADLINRPIAQPLPEAPAGVTWTGFYIGGNLGAAFSPNDASITDLSTDQDLSLRLSNDTELIGGAQAGYNLQLGSFLVGVEGDVDFADNINYLASVRGRAGFALGSWLLYGTGGVAFIDTDTDFTVLSGDNGAFSFNESNSDTGYVVGGGIDYRVTPKLSLGVEGLYYN